MIKSKLCKVFIFGIILSMGLMGCTPTTTPGKDSAVKEETNKPQEETNQDTNSDTNQDTNSDTDQDTNSDTNSADNTEGTTVTLYYPDDELMKMLQTESKENIQSPNDLYAVWEKNAKLDTDTQVLSFSNNTLDLSNQFAVLISNFGTSGELMYIDGLAKTFKEYYNLSELYLTIDGEILETGHNIYDFAL